ncbi:phage baseplate assembly protein V [Saccharothrix sp. ST-888]|uniref:phage baseplate assembly protein V n=1 Tax=Saccharothrix sp. ST-888 TaxID=1427391 RepID=UPI0005ECEC9C|nr:phage baseplate assembly protein V [Saccharothrix sp. ST-888]KJK55523.1 hypothetical protein UK12_28065 [Saccharothrix sp. ST-888]
MAGQLWGTYAATVVEAYDPAGQGRVRLVVPQVHGTSVTGWARRASAGTVSAGDQVYVAYDGGDENYPMFWPASAPPQPSPSAIGAAVAPGPWATLTLAAGWANSTGGADAPVSVRWLGSTDVQLCGVAAYTGGTALTAGVYYTVANLPRGMAPGVNFNEAIAVSWDSGQTFATARCQVAGGTTALQIYLPQTVTLRWVAFDGCLMRVV